MPGKTQGFLELVPFRTSPWPSTQCTRPFSPAPKPLSPPFFAGGVRFTVGFLALKKHFSKSLVVAVLSMGQVSRALGGRWALVSWEVEVQLPGDECGILFLPPLLPPLPLFTVCGPCHCKCGVRGQLGGVGPPFCHRASKSWSPLLPWGSQVLKREPSGRSFEGE